MSGDLVAWVYRLDARASNCRRHLLLIGVSQSILSGRSPLVLAQITSCTGSIESLLVPFYQHPCWVHDELGSLLRVSLQPLHGLLRNASRLLVLLDAVHLVA